MSAAASYGLNIKEYVWRLLRSAITASVCCASCAPRCWRGADLIRQHVRDQSSVATRTIITPPGKTIPSAVIFVDGMECWLVCLQAPMLLRLRGRLGCGLWLGLCIILPVELPHALATETMLAIAACLHPERAGTTPDP